jgi:hypothetical protein
VHCLQVCAKAVVKSDALRDAFIELSELPGAAQVRLLMSRQAPHLVLSAKGDSSSCEIEFPQQAHTETFHSLSFPLMDAGAGGSVFAQTQTPINQSDRWAYHYHLGSLQQALKALPHAAETYLRMNTAGMLCVQHMVSHQTGRSFVDFLIAVDATLDMEVMGQSQSNIGQSQSQMDSQSRADQRSELDSLSRAGDGFGDDDRGDGRDSSSGRDRGTSAFGKDDGPLKDSD